jgi:hypothetical protein
MSFLFGKKTPSLETSMNNLAKNFPNIPGEVIYMYLKSNKGDYDKTSKQLNEEEVKLSKKRSSPKREPPSTPREPPPKQRSSPKQRSPPKQRSSPKREPPSTPREPPSTPRVSPPKQRSSPKREPRSTPRESRSTPRVSPPKLRLTSVYDGEDDGAGILPRGRPASSIPVSIPVPPPSKPVPLAIRVSPPKQRQSTKVSTSSTPLEQLTKIFQEFDPAVIESLLANNKGNLRTTAIELHELRKQEKEQKRGKTMRVSPPKQRPAITSSTSLEQLIKSFPDLEVPAIEAVLKMKHGNLKEATTELRIIAEYEKKQGKKTSHRGETSRRASSSTQLIIPDFTDGIKPIRVQFTFEEWIENSYDVRRASKAGFERKQRLEDLFDKRNWTVLDTNGDGWCGLYGTAVYYNLTNKDNPGFSPVSSRDDIIDKIMLALDNFYIARDQHIRLKIPLPIQLMREDILVEFTPAVEEEYEVKDEKTGKLVKKYRIALDKDTGELKDSDAITITLNRSDHSQKTFSMNQERELIKTHLSKLKRLSNIPNEIFALMPFAYKHNYLILRYDYNLIGAKEGGLYYTNYIPCLLDVQKVGDKIIYPYAQDNLIMYNNGHYFLLLNEKPIVLETVNRILGRDYEGWGLKNVGSGINVRKLRKLRKSKYTTHKNKSKKANFTKNKKQKMRKHKYSVKKMKQPKNKSKKY